MTVPFKRSRFADRGKKAEEAVQRFLTDWASQSSTREYNRLVDSKAAGRIIKAAAADFEYCCKTAYGEEFHGLIEVKETEHEYRLSKDKLPQLPRLRKRQKCGGRCFVLVFHSTLGMWRALTVPYLEGPSDKGSWNLSNVPLHSNVASALASIPRDVFEKAGEVTTAALQRAR